MYRRAAISVLVFAFAGVWTADASAWNTVWRGLDILATPTGSPLITTGDGTRVNGARSGRLRIVPDGVVGKGYRIEYDRSYGADSRGRPETFRFGGLGEMTLSGATQMTAGFTSPAKKLYFGHADINATNLSYNLQTRIGAQDAKLQGTLNATGTLNANVFGFYDLTLNVANTNSQLTIDGVAANDQKDTNFNIGPISVKGNLFLDGALGLLGSTGIRATDLETLFPNSAIQQINDALAADLQANGAQQNADQRSKVVTALVATVLGQNADAANQLMQTLTENPSVLADIAQAAPATPTSIPEAGTLTLLGVGATALITARHRRR